MLNRESTSVSDVLKRKLTSLVTEKYESPVSKLDITPHPLLETRLLLGGVRLLLRNNQYHINVFHQEEKNGARARYIKPRLTVARSHIELLPDEKLRITTFAENTKRFNKFQESIRYAQSAYLPHFIIDAVEENNGQYSVATNTDLVPELIDFIDATSAY